MQWFGVGLMIAGAIAGLWAGLGCHNIPVTIGGGVFFIIGLIIFLKA